MSSRMRNLTLASAKHLLTMGHINKAHHDRIVSASAAPTMPTMPKMPASPFGSLAKKKKTVAAPMFPQQAQAPIPGVGGPSVIPPGMSSGYDDTGG